MTIPASVFWGIIVTASVAILGLGGTVIRNTGLISRLGITKQDKVQCIEQHGGIGREIMAISKDVEALMRHMELVPHQSPFRNGGDKKE